MCIGHGCYAQIYAHVICNRKSQNTKIKAVKYGWYIEFTIFAGISVLQEPVKSLTGLLQHIAVKCNFFLIRPPSVLLSMNLILRFLETSDDLLRKNTWFREKSIFLVKPGVFLFQITVLLTELLYFLCKLIAVSGVCELGDRNLISPRWLPYSIRRACPHWCWAPWQLCWSRSPDRALPSRL